MELWAPFIDHLLTIGGPLAIVCCFFGFLVWRFILQTAADAAKWRRFCGRLVTLVLIKSNCKDDEIKWLYAALDEEEKKGS